jgi:hypothetical protein
VAALGTAGAVAALAPGTGVAAAPIKNPEAIVCPDAPGGWNALPVRKVVDTPQSVPEPDAEEHFQTGGNLVRVACTYYAATNTHVTVTVSYALPSDVNPVNDFYWGCGAGTMRWNESYRVYRVPSVTQWANATLIDAGGFLPARDVPAFRTVTDRLLENAEGYGHACKLLTRPTAVALKYTFDIKAAGGNLKSQFLAEEAAKNGVHPIVQSTVTTARVRVTADGKSRPLTIRLARGLDFRPATARSAGQVRYAVKVVSSKVPSCRGGAAGTLTITTRPSVLLAVCGQRFLRGADVGRVRFFPA